MKINLHFKTQTCQPEDENQLLEPEKAIGIPTACWSATEIPF